MSEKINFKRMITDHFSTFDSNRKAMTKDILAFIALPLALGIGSSVFNLLIESSTISLLTNFGSIFSALLLSVIVLVYDQKVKIQDTPDDDISQKKKLLSYLFNNICYAILVSVLLVFSCFIYNMFLTDSYDFPDIWIKIGSGFLVFLATHLFLTILMILKRFKDSLS